MSGSCIKRWSGAEREAGGRGAATEPGGWSAEKVFRRSHDLDACYSVLCLWCLVFLCMARSTLGEYMGFRISICTKIDDLE